jgi:peptide deformylase
LTAKSAGVTVGAMAVRPIRLYPDPVLLHPTEPVEHFDEAIRLLVQDMADTMYHAPGIGLAANQIGVALRVCIVDLSAGEEPGRLQVFVNPRVVSAEGQQVGEEGCLSFPDVTLEIERAERATVEALDLDGRSFSLAAEGMMARALLHECEHLDGQVFLRNVSPLKRELVKKQIRKRIKAGDWVEATAK